MVLSVEKINEEMEKERTHKKGPCKNYHQKQKWTLPNLNQSCLETNPKKAELPLSNLN